MWWQSNTTIKISIHALLAESDSKPAQPQHCTHQFLSTLSLRRATTKIGNFDELFAFLSTLSLRRATRWVRSRRRPSADFYPRSPCGERPRYFNMPSWNTSDFYPRSPCGERRFVCTVSMPPCTDFYPRSPCGERPCRSANTGTP